MSKSKNFFVMMMTTLLFSSTAYGQVDPLVRARETYTSLYRAAPIACRAPQCTAVSGRTRVIPRNLEEYQEANRFLIAGARACLVDCTCNVQNATTPSYCSTEQAAAPAVAAPQPRTAAPAAPAPAPAASAPAVAATPTLPPYMPNGMFQGQSYAQIGYCTNPRGFYDTKRTFESIGIFDAIWYTPGTRRQTQLVSAAGGGVSVTSPITITIETMPSQFWMVITVNGREVMLLRNGQAQVVVQEQQNGGHCVRSALPAMTHTTFSMELEGDRPDVEIGVFLYLPTASGALGARIRGPNVNVRSYQIADLLNQQNRIVISSTDGGLNSDI